MGCARALSEFVKFFVGDVDPWMHAHQLGTQAGLARAHQLDQRMFAFTIQGKWKWRDVTCESGQGFAKSIG